MKSRVKKSSGTIDETMSITVGLGRVYLETYSGVESMTIEGAKELSRRLDAAIKAAEIMTDDRVEGIIVIDDRPIAGGVCHPPRQFIEPGDENS